MLRTLFVIAVPDQEASAAFYRDVLGFEVTSISDPGWRIYSRDGCRIMAGECPHALHPTELGDHSYFAYLVIDDIDNFYESVQLAGAQICKPLRTEPWGMHEFGVVTVDGHRIMFGASVPTV